MSTQARQSVSSAASNGAGAARLDRALFLVLLAVLCARPLISETFERVDLSFLPPGGTTPATMVWLDSLLLIASLLVWIRHWRSQQRVGVVGIALLLLLAAVVVSVFAANDKQLAANAGAHLFVMALAGVALIRVMRARWMVRLLLAAALASGVTNAVKCVTQRTGEFDATLQYWQEQKAGLTNAGLIDPNSPAVVNYERRLRSAEAYGHLSHPNVTASCLTMCLLVAAGIFMGVLRRPDFDANRRTAPALVAAAAVVTLAAGLWLTSSMGAAVAAAVGGLLALAIGLGRTWIGRHTRQAFALLALGYVAVIAAGAGYGLLKGTLPHTSLAFRWHYWQAAARTVVDTPLTGIGRENFRGAYMLHKSLDSTEEVSNPHNVWLSLLVELGPLGLIAGALLLGAACYGVLRGFGEEGRRSPTHPARGMLVASALAVLVVQGVFSGEPLVAPGMLLLWAVFVAGVWIVAFTAALLLIAQVDEHPTATAWLLAGLAAALFAALIHNLIGFSLLTPAGLSVFIAFGAGAWALPLTEHRPGQPLRGPAHLTSHARLGLTVIVAALVVVAYGYAVASPTIRSEATLTRIRATVHAARDYAAIGAALHKGHETVEIAPWGAELPRAIADMAFALAARADLPDEVRHTWLDEAAQYASVACQRAPRSFAARRLQAEIHAAQARLADDPGLLAVAAYDWEDAVALYPTNPRARIAAGVVWFDLWETTGLPEHAQRAAEQLENALAIDARRLPEVAAKLRPAELHAIQRRLDELHAAGIDSPTSSTPSSRPPP